MRKRGGSSSRRRNWKAWEVLPALLIVSIVGVDAMAGQIGKVKASGDTEKAAIEDGIRKASVKVLKDHYGFRPAHPISQRILKMPIDVLKNEVIAFPPKGRIRKRSGSYSGTLKFSSNDDGLEAFVTKTVSKYLEDSYVKNVGAVFTLSITAPGQSLDGQSKEKFSVNINEELRTVMGKYGVKLRALPQNLVQFLTSLNSSDDSASGNEYLSNIRTAINKMETSEKGRVDVIVVGDVDVRGVEPGPGGGQLVSWYLKGRVIENIAGKTPDQQNQHNFSVDGGASFGKDINDALHAISLKAAYNAVTDGILDKLTAPESATKRYVVRLCGSFSKSMRAKVKMLKGLKNVVGSGEIDAEKDNTVFTLSNSGHENALELYSALDGVFEKLDVEPEVVGNTFIVGDSPECSEAVQTVEASQAPEAADMKEVVAEAAKEALSQAVSQNGKNATFMLLRMTSRQGKASCQPLSKNLMDELRGAIEKQVQKKNLGIRFIEDSDEWVPDVAAVLGEWDNQGRGRIGLTVVIASEAGKVTVNKAFKAQSLRDQEQRCLLSVSEVSKEFTTKRKIPVVDSPFREAKGIDELTAGQRILVNARIKDTPWKIVRLPDDDHLPVGLRERRGFIYATTGPDGDLE